ncbi:MAG: HlyC/CorC family transporter [Ardenticatenaceae bacterium]|nr:HlyC/CorC family transporter [Ardenticatenaceae bacterium]
MSTIWLPLFLVFLLILLNGLFAMSEIAIISAKRTRLQSMAQNGRYRSRAKAALKLMQDPNRFLSTVQVGITLIGILAGAYGEKTIAQELALLLEGVPGIGRYSDTISLIIVVSTITYLSVVVGELVPKRLGMQNAESVSLFVARPMQFLSWVATPIVQLLSTSTDVILRLLGVAKTNQEIVSEEEIKMLVGQGVQAGTIQEAERAIVNSVFRFGDRRLEALMTPRTEVIWLDINDPPETIQQIMEENIFSRFPVCDGDLDRVVGVVRAKDMIAPLWEGQPLDLRQLAQEPLFLPETMMALSALERFRETGIHLGLLVDEFGGVEGLVTLIDLLEALVGDIPTEAEIEDPPLVQREDGSWLVDALLLIDDFKTAFAIDQMPAEGSYQTVGGFVVLMLGQIPKAGDTFIWQNCTFEVVDMDGNRVDKVLVKCEPYSANLEDDEEIQ